MGKTTKVAGLLARYTSAGLPDTEILACCENLVAHMRRNFAAT
jgi:hypothetical protein